MRIKLEGIHDNWPSLEAGIKTDSEYFASTFRPYAHVRCCNCGKILGVASVKYNPETDLALCVGKKEDEEGYEWRSFCPKCAKAVQGMSASEIYAKYPASEFVD